MSTVFANRRRALQKRLSEEKLDRLLVTHPADCYYLTGFTGDSGALVISREAGKRASLVTDGRFLRQASDETTGVTIVPQAGALYAAVGKFLSSGRRQRVGFDSGQVTVAQYQELLRATGKHVAWRAASGLVAGLRMRKEPL